MTQEEQAKLYWRGKSIKLLTREELEQALIESHLAYLRAMGYSRQLFEIKQGAR